nr:LuxR family transcriptional regulator [Ornithinimicrobium sp. F0845]
MVGRDRELDALVTAVTSPPAVVVIEGEAGAGKTRLLAELEADPRLGGLPVLRGSCRRLGDPFPLGPLVETLRGQQKRLAEAVLPAVTGGLRPLLPELAAILPPALEPLDDPLAERHRVFRAVADLLHALGPVVLVIEDLHCADAQTVELVGQLITAPPPGLALVVSVRDDEVEPWVRGALAVTGPVPPLRLRLGALGPADTRPLASAILGVDDLSEEFATYLWERASGIPFAIEELLALLQARGTLIRHGSRWVRRTLDRLDVPYRIRDAVLERASRLSRPAREALEAAAVLQVAQPVEVIAAICSAASDAVEDGLEEALAAGLLSEDGDRVGFRHLLTAQAVYESISGVRRRRLHARAATALSGPAGSVEDQPWVEAHHLHRAGRLAAWAVAAERAAVRAVELYDDEQACRLLADVLREAPLDGEARSRVALRLARVANDVIPEISDLPQLIAQAIDVMSDPSVAASRIQAEWRGELRLRLALQLEQTGGDSESLRRLYLEALDDLTDPALRAWAMIGLGIPHTDGVEPAEHRHWLHGALGQLPRVDDPVTRVFLRGKVAMVLVVMGDPAWRALAEGVAVDTGGTPRLRREVNAYDTIGIQACYAGHHGVAATYLTVGLDGARECGSPRLELRLRRSLALLDYCRGRWTGLAERVAGLVDDLSDFSRAGVDVESVHACLSLARGEIESAQSLLEAAVDRTESLGANDLLSVPATALVRLRLSRDEFDSAVELGVRVLATAERKGVWAPALRVLPVFVEALLATADRAGEAGDWVAGVRRAVADLDAPLADSVLMHADGLLAADPVAAAALLERAAKTYAALDCTYEAAQCREAIAGRLTSADPVAAGDALRAALDGYRRLGASWDEARAHRLARRLGVAVPGRHRGGRQGYGDALSPREREVAELVAVGHTNAQIGRDLHLSVKTVEKHVAAAKQKLDAPTRAAFARILLGSDNSGGFSP